MDALKPKLILESPREIERISFCKFDENILIGGCKNGQIVRLSLFSWCFLCLKVVIIGYMGHTKQIAKSGRKRSFDNCSTKIQEFHA